METTTYYGLLIAVVGLFGSAVVAWLQSRSQARKTAAEMYASLCESQQARISHLELLIKDNEIQLAVMRREVNEMRRANDLLRARVHELELENVKLRAQLMSLGNGGKA